MAVSENKSGSPSCALLILLLYAPCNIRFECLALGYCALLVRSLLVDTELGDLLRQLFRIFVARCLILLALRLLTLAPFCISLALALVLLLRRLLSWLAFRGRGGGRACARWRSGGVGGYCRAV